MAKTTQDTHATARTITADKLMKAVMRTYGPLAKAAAINEAFFPGRGWVRLDVDARRTRRDWREVLAGHIQLTAELGATAWNIRIYAWPNQAGQEHNADFHLAELVG